MEQETKVTELIVVQQNNNLYIDSRVIAEYVDKRHDNLVRDIEKYINVLTQNSILDADQNSKMSFDVSQYFVESSYVAGTGKAYKYFLCTKKGCDMIAHKMTGEKGILFTAAYIEKFYQMEEQMKTAQQVKPMTQIEVLHAVTGELLKQEQKLLQHDQKIAAVESQQADQAARLAAIEEKTQERVFAYPDKKKAKKLSDMMYRIEETKVQCALEEDPESEESIGKHIEDLKDMVVAQISERLERDLRKELKQAQEYYIKKYIDAKSKDKSPAVSVLRPAEARKLTLVAYVSSDPGLYSLVKNLLDDKEDEG